MEYHLLRRSQASIAGFRHFDNGDLAKFLERDLFLAFAEKLTDHYFHRSKGLAIHGQVKEISLAQLVRPTTVFGCSI